MSTYYVENFGCRATQADGAALECQLEQHGLARAATARDAALVVLNTCTVTSAADQDARAAIRRVQRQNPKAKIVVTGCYAQRAPEEIAALPGVSCVIGNSHKYQLAEIALHADEGSEPAAAFVPLHALTPISEGTNDQRPIFVSDIFAHTELLAAPVFEASNHRTRPNLKVQDGCDNRCSFCVIPYVRGQSRSLPLQQILAEVQILVAAGYREVVISGINLGRWGRDLAPMPIIKKQSLPDQQPFSCPERSEGTSGQRRMTNDQRLESPDRRLESLIRAILSETQLDKLRISSVEPMDWTDDLISLVAQSPRIARHAHVPLQSGSDAVLRRMHRKYRPWHYREKIEKIRAAMLTAAIGADVMVGFPGETDADFDSTRRLIEDLPFTYLHVFTYSPRPGTPAASMPNQVPVKVAQERNRILRDLAAEKKQAFMRSFVGKSLEAITLGSPEEEPCGAGTPAREAGTPDQCGAGAPTRELSGTQSEAPFTEALTDNYLKLRLKGRHHPNRWLRTQVENVVDGSLVACLA